MRSWQVTWHLNSYQGIHSREDLIGALRRFWALKTQRIIQGTALIDHLRKHITAQRLVLSTAKHALYQLSYGPKR
jgi:hypothetical protein